MNLLPKLKHYFSYLGYLWRLLVYKIKDRYLNLPNKRKTISIILVIVLVMGTFTTVLLNRFLATGEGFQISGYLYDKEARSPLADVKVELSGGELAEGATNPTVQSDSDGHYDISAPSKDYTQISYTKDNYYDQQGIVSVDTENIEANLTMEPGFGKKDIFIKPLTSGRYAARQNYLPIPIAPDDPDPSSVFQEVIPSGDSYIEKSMLSENDNLQAPSTSAIPNDDFYDISDRQFIHSDILPNTLNIPQGSSAVYVPTIDKAYFFYGAGITGQFQELDLSTMQLTAIPCDILDERTNASVVYASNQNAIYLFGGSSPIPNHQPIIRRFNVDEQNNTIVPDANFGLQMTNFLSNSAAVYANNKIYLIGGHVIGRDYTGATSEIWEYDLQSPNLQKVADLPDSSKRQNTVSAYMDSLKKIVIIGGQDNNTVYSDLYFFDPISKEIKKQDTGPNPAIANASSYFIDGHLYTLGGITQDTPTTTKPIDDVNSYEGSGPIYFVSKLPKPLTSYASFQKDKNVYLFGGTTTSNTSNDNIIKFRRTFEIIAGGVYHLDNTENAKTLIVKGTANYSDQTISLKNPANGANLKTYFSVFQNNKSFSTRIKNGDNEYALSDAVAQNLIEPSIGYYDQASNSYKDIPIDLETGPSTDMTVGTSYFLTATSSNITATVTTAGQTIGSEYTLESYQDINDIWQELTAMGVSEDEIIDYLTQLGLCPEGDYFDQETPIEKKLACVDNYLETGEETISQKNIIPTAHATPVNPPIRQKIWDITNNNHSVFAIISNISDKAVDFLAYMINPEEFDLRNEVEHVATPEHIQKYYKGSRIDAIHKCFLDKTMWSSEDKTTFYNRKEFAARTFGLSSVLNDIEANRNKQKFTKSEIQGLNTLWKKFKYDEVETNPDAIMLAIRNTSPLLTLLMFLAPGPGEVKLLDICEAKFGKKVCTWVTKPLSETQAGKILEKVSGFKIGGTFTELSEESIPRIFDTLHLGRIEIYLAKIAEKSPLLTIEQASVFAKIMTDIMDKIVTTQSWKNLYTTMGMTEAQANARLIKIAQDSHLATANMIRAARGPYSAEEIRNIGAYISKDGKLYFNVMRLKASPLKNQQTVIHEIIHTFTGYADEATRKHFVLKRLGLFTAPLEEGATEYVTKGIMEELDLTYNSGGIFSDSNHLANIYDGMAELLQYAKKISPQSARREVLFIVSSGHIERGIDQEILPLVRKIPPGDYNRFPVGEGGSLHNYIYNKLNSATSVDALLQKSDEIGTDFGIAARWYQGQP